MLLLLFDVNGTRYGLDVRDVLVVVADECSRPLPGAPSGVAGLLLHGGKPIPVIDVTEVITGKPARRRLSTRIVIVPFEDGTPGARIGLRLERANDAVHVDPAAFRDIGVTAVDSPCLGPIADLGDGLVVQLVKVDSLLTPALKASLLGTPPPEAAA